MADLAIITHQNKHSTIFTPTARRIIIKGVSTNKAGPYNIFSWAPNWYPITKELNIKNISAQIAKSFIIPVSHEVAIINSYQNIWWLQKFQEIYLMSQIMFIKNCLVKYFNEYILSDVSIFRILLPCWGHQRFHLWSNTKFFPAKNPPSENCSK